MKDPNLPRVDDDPRKGTTIYRAQGGRNTESFDPASTFVRPSMRVIYGPKARIYNKKLKHDDVVIVPEFCCEKDDLTMYYKLIEEMQSL